MVTPTCAVCGKIITGRNKVGVCQRTPECRNERQKRWVETQDPVRYYRVKSNAELVRHYGITISQYDAMFAAQGGQCAICHTTSPGALKGRFQVDHDHETGKVRALLCNSCNRTKVGSNTVESARAVLSYLEAFE